MFCLFFLLLSVFGSSQEKVRLLRSLESPVAAERKEAQLQLAGKLSSEDEEILLVAIREGSPEKKRRLVEIFSWRPDFFSLLLKWRPREGPESEVAAESALRLFISFRGEIKEEKKAPSPDPLEFWNRVWVKLPDSGISFLRLVDDFHRFGAVSKPLLLDPRLGEFWVRQDLGAKEREDFAGPLFQRILDELSLDAGEKLEMQDFPAFLWVGKRLSDGAESEAVSTVFISWNSPSSAVRRVAALALGSWGFGPAERVLQEEFLRRGPFWKEALAGLCGGWGVSPFLKDGKTIESLVQASRETTGLEREIAHTLIRLGREDLPANLAALRKKDPKQEKTPDLEKLCEQAVVSENAASLGRTCRDLEIAAERGYRDALGALFLRRLGKESDPLRKMKLACAAAFAQIPLSPEARSEAKELLLAESWGESSPFGDSAVLALARIADSGLRERIADLAGKVDLSAEVRRRALRAMTESFRWMSPVRARQQEIKKYQYKLRPLFGKEDLESEKIFACWDGDAMRAPVFGENLLDRDEFR